MAPKRRVTIQSDSEDEAPRSTQRKRQRTSPEDTDAGAEPGNNVVDEEEELQFEREHEEAFMQRVQERADDVKKHKVIGVCFVADSDLKGWRIDAGMPGCCAYGYHRKGRDD